GVLLLFGAHLYGAASWGVAQRITQQVDQHLDDPVGICLHSGQVCSNIRCQRHALLYKLRADTPDGLVDQRDWGAWPQLERQLMRLGARKLLQLLHQPPQPPGLVVKQCPCFRAWSNHAVEQSFGVAFDRRQRRPQFVRHVADERHPSPLRHLELGRHAIKLPTIGPPSWMLLNGASGDVQEDGASTTATSSRATTLPICVPPVAESYNAKA